MVRTFYKKVIDDNEIIRELIKRGNNSADNLIHDPRTEEPATVDVEALVESGEAFLFDSEIELGEFMSYQRVRAKEYPAIEDQLDYIYHNGIAKWKSDMVKPVKDAHPKP